MVSLGPVLLAQLALQSLRAGQQFALVYLLIRAWGAAYYGDWVVLMSAATFFTLFDIGIQTVLSNQCLALSRDEDSEKLSQVIGSFLGFYLLFVPAVCLLTIGAVYVLDISTLAPTGLLTGTTRDVVFLSLAFSFLFGIPLSALGGVYAARGNIAKGISRVSIQLIIQTLLIVLAIEFNSSVITIALTYPISTLLCLIWVIFDISRRYPNLSLRPRLNGAFHCVGLVRLSVFYFISPFAGFVSQNVPIYFFASVVADSKAVAVFAVTRTLVGLLRQLTTQIANACGVETMRRWFRQETEKSYELFMEANRFISTMSGLLGGYVLAVAPTFIALWTQNKVDADPGITFILVATVCLTSPTYLPLALLQIGNRPYVLTAGIVVQAALTFFFALLTSYSKNYLFLLLLLGLNECLIDLFITFRARAEFKFVNLREIVTSYFVCVLAGSLAFGVTRGAFAVFSLHTTIWPFVISSVIAGVPMLILLFFLGVSAPVRNSIVARIMK